MKKWYNCEIEFRTVADSFMFFLVQMGVYCERSSAPGAHRFEIHATPAEAEMIGAWLDPLVLVEVRA